MSLNPVGLSSDCVKHKLGINAGAVLYRVAGVQ